MSDIRIAAARSSSLRFREYDQQFRLKLSKNPSGTLGVFDSELWLLYVIPSAKFLTADTPNQSQNKKCYTYNHHGSYFKALCYYLHLYLKCNASHQLISCSKKEKCNSQRGTLHFGVGFTTEPPEVSIKIQGERGREGYQYRW